MPYFDVIYSLFSKINIGQNNGAFLIVVITFPRRNKTYCSANRLITPPV